jgi:choline monooxygenase
MPEDHRPSPLADVLAPIDRARGLPNAHYTDPATIAAETEACLETTWAAIGVGADVPEPGDAKPLELPGPAAPDAARRQRARCASSTTSAAIAA